MRKLELENLLAAFLAEPWTERGLVSRAKAALGRSHRFVPAFARRVLARFPNPTHFDRLAQFAEGDTEFQKAWELAEPKIAKHFYPISVMAPHPSAVAWNVPSITTVAELCERLRIDAHQLDWLADVAGRNRRETSTKLQHYRYRWLPKPDGRSRLLEIPKAMLKTIQRRILHEILDRIPPHPAAHGFRAGRSIKTNAEHHTGRAVVVRFDLQDFFPSISPDKVWAVFRTTGYPPEIAELLVGLCTARLPSFVWNSRPNPAPDGRDFSTWQRLRSRHLPQGAPTSPALANLAAYALDCRLAAYASSLDLTYTRYADDLTFSGGADFARITNKFCNAIGRIVREEGFHLNAEKTHVMLRSVRQTVAGVVVNIRPSVPRDEFDRLKAIIFNCIRHGPEIQNRENRPDFRAYLAGKIAHVAMLNPIRGRKLLIHFDRIRWQSSESRPTIPA